MNHRPQEPSPAPWSQQSYGFWPEMSKAGAELASGDSDRAKFSRRSALGILAASAALAGLPGCRRPDIELRPYSKMPENVVPGMSLFYCTSVHRGGAATPVLVETHEGRPTKVEGHPGYAPTQGGSDAMTQAMILELYDPDRLRQVRRGNVTSTWKDFDAFAETHFAAILKNAGKGFRILSDATPSPAWDLLRQHLAEVAPQAKWHVYEPLASTGQQQALESLADEPLHARYDLEKADIVVSLDADFLNSAETGATSYARQFAARRTPESSGGMNRLYVFEPTMSITGGMADHRFRARGGEIADIAVALAKELKLFTAGAGWSAESAGALATAAGKLSPRTSIDSKVLSAIAADLRENRGKSLIVAGPRQPAHVHMLCHAMNIALGNAGKTVRYTQASAVSGTGTLAELVSDAASGEVETLLIIGGNPVYDAPAEMKFAEKLSKIKHTIKLSLYEDETARSCRWRLPVAHAFESWGDTLTPQGDYLPVQPMIAPLYNGRSPLTLLAKLLRYQTDQEYEIVQASFAARRKSLAEDMNFNRWVHEGVAKIIQPAASPATDAAFAGRLAEQLNAATSQRSADELEVCFQIDPSVYDGRFANLGWLQEAPDPVTKLTWDNAALISGETAKKLNAATGDVVKLTLDGRSVEAPVMIQPGHANNSISLPLGYGRINAGRVGDEVGFNAYTLRTADNAWFATGVKVEPTGRTHRFARTQEHDRIDDRDIARESTIEQFKARAEALEKNGHHAADGAHGPAGDKGPAGHAGDDHADDHSHGHGGGTGHADQPLIEPPKMDGKHQWGMVIDLNKCIGCNACMVACQSENNIPVVGKEEIAIGRSMHWIRVDRYYRGPEAEPDMIHEPVACVHCENAPCETVCPVNAAVHSPEGLNLQVYNRCVGTRYCSNNCPYKARRFNWFDYQQRELDQLRLGPLGDLGMEETLKMQKNPDVTVRMRGVMEKCTYCVQRIERGKAGAKLAMPGSPDYNLTDGQVTPACAQACPSQAIVFGDLNDSESRVVKQKADPRRFDLLDAIGTKPRTSYLERLRNPNPRIEALSKKAGDA